MSSATPLLPQLAPLIIEQHLTPDLTGSSVGQYTLLDKVGSGGFATVYKALDTLSNEYVAIKCIEKTAFSKLSTESAIMLGLHHPNIVHLYGCIETVEWVYIVLEHCDMDLFQAIATIDFTDAIVHEIFSQILKAVQHCHNHGVSHRDLKPENILISVRKSDSTIRLADFGMHETCHSHFKV